MGKKKGLKKRYRITIIGVVLAVLSVVLLRTFDIDFDQRKIMAEKEIKAVMEFNKEVFSQVTNKQSADNQTKFLRDTFSNKISYKKFLDENNDFRNFKYLPDKKIYGLQLMNRTHIGFYHNSDDCGNMNDNKDYCFGVIVDTNGYTRPNQFGKDQFLLKIYKNGVME